MTAFPPAEYNWVEHVVLHRRWNKKNATTKGKEYKFLDLCTEMPDFVSLFLLSPVVLIPISVYTVSSPHWCAQLNTDKQEEVVILL